MLVELDEVLFVRQLESLDAGGQPGDGFVFAERVERPDAGVAVGPCRIVFALRGEQNADTRPWSARRTAVQEIGADHAFLVSPRRVPFDHRLEQPSPALAVVLGGLPTFRHCVEDRIAVGIDRRTLRLAAVAPAFFVVGQRVEVGERLQPPGLCRLPKSTASANCLSISAGSTLSSAVSAAFIALRNSCSARTRSRAVACTTLAAAAMLAAVELAGDHEAVMLDVEIRLGDRHRAVANRLDGRRRPLRGTRRFRSTRLSCCRQAIAVSNARGQLGGGRVLVQHQLAQAVVGFFVVAVVVQLACRSFSDGGASFGGRSRWSMTTTRQPRRASVRSTSIATIEAVPIGQSANLATGCSCLVVPCCT